MSRIPLGWSSNARRSGHRSTSPCHLWTGKSMSLAELFNASGVIIDQGFERADVHRPDAALRVFGNPRHDRQESSFGLATRRRGRDYAITATPPSRCSIACVLDQAQLRPLHLPDLALNAGVKQLERGGHQSLKFTRSSASGTVSLLASADGLGATTTFITVRPLRAFRQSRAGIVARGGIEQPDKTGHGVARSAEVVLAKSLTRPRDKGRQSLIRDEVLGGHRRWRRRHEYACSRTYRSSGVRFFADGSPGRRGRRHCLR